MEYGDISEWRWFIHEFLINSGVNQPDSLEKKRCLHCKQELIGPFCHHCGQSASTHRFSFKSVFTQDFLHHLKSTDRSYFSTLKALFIHPGRSVRSYVEGHRLKLINYFSFIVIVILIDSFLRSLSSIHMDDLVNDQKESVSSLENFRAQHPKIMIMSMIPLRAAFSYLFFKRAKLNYSEHIVLNTYLTSATLIISTVFTIVSIFYTNIEGLRHLNQALLFVVFLYESWFYNQYFSIYGYSKSILLLRSILCAFLLILCTLIALALFILYFNPQID